MRIDILTLFPEMFVPLKESIIGRAKDSGKVQIEIIDIRDYTLDKHKKCDDYPFGGGAGMLMMPQPIADAIEAVDPNHEALRIYTSPKGKTFEQKMVSSLLQNERILLLCGLGVPDLYSGNNPICFFDLPLDGKADADGGVLSFCPPRRNGQGNEKSISGKGKEKTLSDSSFRLDLEFRDSRGTEIYGIRCLQRKRYPPFLWFGWLRDPRSASPHGDFLLYFPDHGIFD